MAHVTLLAIPASAFIPDQNAQLVGGDAPARQQNHVGRTALAFDADDEQAATTPEYPMPGQYAAGTLKATLFLYHASNNADDIAFDVFVEAITPLDTLDLEAATGWDSANAGTVSLGGTTAGDLVTITITLTNKDSVAAGDLVRFGVRRDCDSGNDDAAGDTYLASLDIWEDT